MAYGREILRKAGDRIRQFDDAYSEKLLSRLDKVAESMEPLNSAQILGVGTGHVLSQPSLRKYTEEGNHVPAWAAYGIPAASATAKYVVPGAAAGLAVKGIYDVVQMASPYDQQTSGTIMP
jgi:hypothetical protein